MAARRAARRARRSGERVGICATTEKVAVDELFAGFGSELLLETVAVFVAGPTVWAFVTMVIVAVTPEAIVPSEQVTVVVPLQVPWLGVADTNVTLAGSTSTIVTPVAEFGPAFVTAIVKVAFELTRTSDAVDLVIERSDTAAATVVVAVAELFPALRSAVPELIVAVFVMIEPTGAPELTCTTSVNVAGDAAIRVGFVAITVPLAPTAGAVTVQPAGAVKDTNVVFAGVRSVMETPVASLGPLFVAVSEYDSVVPAVATAGALLVIARSALGVTVVDAVDELFAAFVSELSLVTEAVFETDVTFPGVTVSVNCALAPEPSWAILHEIVPLPPTPGVEQIAAGPVFCTSESNVVPAGMTSVSWTLSAMSGPALSTVIVYVSGFPATTVAGPAFVTDRSTDDTVTSADELSFSEFGSFADEMVATLVNVVPDAVAAGMFPTSV
jgi:hypothetical protein